MYTGSHGRPVPLTRLTSLAAPWNTKAKVGLLGALILAIAGLLRTASLQSTPPPLADEIFASVDIHLLLSTGRHFTGSTASLLGHIIPVLDGRYLVALVSAADVADLRLFSAICGIATVGLLFLLGAEFGSPKLGYLAAAALAIMPWHIYLSRLYLPQSEYLFLTTLSVLLLVVGLRRRSAAMLTGSVLAGVATVYIYPTAIVTTPLILAGASLYRFAELRRLHLSILVVPIVIGTLSVTPYLIDHLTASDVIDANGVITSKLIWNHGMTPGATVLFFASNWTGYLTPWFILFQGDPNPAHSVQTIGEVGWISGALGVVGILVGGVRRTRLQVLLLFWLFVYPIGDAVTFYDANGNSLRGVVGCVVWAFWIAIGAEWILDLLGRTGVRLRGLGLSLVCVGLMLQIFAFASVYWGGYSQRYDYLFETGYEPIYTTLRDQGLTHIPITLHAGYARNAMLQYFSAYQLSANDSLPACNDLPYEAAHPKTLPRIFIVKEDPGYAALPGCISSDLPARDWNALNASSHPGEATQKVDLIAEFPSDSARKYYTAIFYVHR